MAQTAQNEKHTWREEFRDLMRGVGGAAIIGVPLVYTMEVWQAATTLGTGEIFKLLGFGFAVCAGYNFFSGFRRGGTFLGAVRDATEALAIGAIFGAVLMLVLGIIDHETPFTDAMCKIALESVPLAMGVSVANTQFDGGQSNREEGNDPPDEKKTPEKQDSTLREIGVAAAGSLILASSIAPTEEVMVISHHSSPFGLLVIVVFSLLLSYGMIFVADFTGAEARTRSKGVLQSPFGETVLCYAVALAISLVSVRFFHGVRITDSPYSVVALTIALGLPATIGGAAGRLIV